VKEGPLGEVTNDQAIQGIYQQVRAILIRSRSRAWQAVNTEMVACYWEIGRLIVEEEQRGETRAAYGKGLIKELSTRLSAEFGKGFDKSNLWNMRAFFLCFPKIDALRRELSWTHYRLLLRVEKSEARAFYEAEAVNSRWSTRELERQINSLLFERLALSRDKVGILERVPHRRGDEPALSRVGDGEGGCSPQEKLGTTSVLKLRLLNQQTKGMSFKYKVRPYLRYLVP